MESDAAVDDIQDGHYLEVDLEKGEIINKTTGLAFHANRFPPFIHKIIDDGGLIENIAKRIGKP